ncbi:hypothetical protein ABZ896_03745 [Streptomyces sp. NPDC047072]|uniref:hypothetical protein n=1 Tax=Streptomyces sp. NPDC047072 TaxID=3154809 RepID=UPI0033F80659
MAVEQLPGRVREFTNYLAGLLARLDQGAGWCAVFWQRDPDGMRACLDGREVPPWDVVEALLQDLATGYGAEAARAEVEHARTLHAGALADHDARPGARDVLGDRFDVMLREQRYAAERQAELGRLLAAAPTQDQADAIRLDLAWARDDHERASRRCAELRSRMDELDRNAMADQARAIRRGRGADGGVFRLREGDVRGGAEGAGAARGRAPGEDARRGAGAWGQGAVVRDDGDRDLGAAPLSMPRQRDGSDAALTGYAAEPSVSSEAPQADPVSHQHPQAPHQHPSAPSVPVSPRHPSPEAAPADTAPSPHPTPSAQPPEAPAPKQRKRRRGSARFAGMVEEEAAPVVVPPHTGAELPAAPAAKGRTPRGARFAGAGRAEAQVEPQGVTADGTDRRETAETVVRLVRLRAEGRTGEAHALLVEIAHWPAARFPLLAAEMQHAGLGADWATLLWEAASLPADRLVAAADALVAAGRGTDGEQILRQGVARPAGEIGAAVLGLVAEGRRREVAALLDAYVRVRSPEEAARSAEPGPQTLVPLLLTAARGVSQERHWDLVHALRVAGFSA